ncbi:MAG: helix-turn-helix domain-containing protein [Anaerolineae bacterium]
MSEIGRLLREARTAKEMSLADVEAATRIRQKYLDALERGEFQRLPRGTVARGFLRTYASYLGLDVEAALRQYTEESGDAGIDVPIAEPGKPRLVDYRPLEVMLEEGKPAALWWPWALALALILALAGGGWWLLGRQDNSWNWNPLQAFGPVPSSTATQTATRWVVTATPRPTATETQLLPTPTSGLLILPTPTVPPSPTPTPQPTATPEVVTRITLELRATQRAWLRITVDGQVVEEGMLEAGQERVWEADQRITVRTGNAGGVILILNGEELGPMGAIGQVVERSWIVENEQITETAADTPVPPTLQPATATPTPAG